MIPTQNVVAWGNVVPWADQRQVEQDLIISRVLVEIFWDELLRDALRCRGGSRRRRDRGKRSTLRANGRKSPWTYPSRVRQATGTAMGLAG